MWIYTSYLLIPQLTGHLGWFYFLIFMKNVALNINVQIFGYMFATPLSQYLGM